MSLIDREKTAAHLCRVAVDGVHCGEKAQLNALDSLEGFTDIPFVVQALRGMTGDDFHYGEKATLKAIHILGRMA